jgi:glycosyltransferase involved in cell wall biosynthesis
VLVSVIITNYNYGRFLGEAIDSVLTQTHRNVECIVVDDGSTDNSREVIESRPMATAIFKQNGGQAKALRTGVEAARGEIIISLDADDYLCPDACAEVVAAWVPGLSCLNYRLSLNGDPARQWPAEPFLEKGHAAFLLANGYYPSAPMSGNAFNRAYASELLARAEHLDGDGVDAYLLYSAPFFGKMAHVDRALGVYRTHGGNVSMTSGRKTVRNLGDHAYYQYWAQQNALRFAREKGVQIGRRSCLVGAYPSLWMLVAKDGGYDRRPLPDQSRLLTTLMAFKGFLSQPGIGALRRFKNIVLLLLLLPAPLPLRRQIARSAIL